MILQKLIFKICPRCQSTFINRTENENQTWTCSDCHHTLELQLIAKFSDLEEKDLSG